MEGREKVKEKEREKEKESHERDGPFPTCFEVVDSKKLLPVMVSVYLVLASSALYSRKIYLFTQEVMYFLGLSRL